jgi:hypothetical protein
MPRKNITEKIPPQNKHTASKRHHPHHSQNGTKIHRNSKTTNDFFEEYGNHLALGAVAMGLAGIGTFLLLNSKNKRRGFGEQIYDTYADYKDDAEDIANNVYEKGREIYDYATECAGNIRNKMKDSPHSWSLLLLAAAGGITVGGTVAYLIRQQPQTNKNFLNKLIDVVDNIKESANSVTENINSNDWIQTAKDVLENINDKIGLEKNSSKPHGNFSIQNAIDLGITGFKLWECLSKKK